MCETGRSCDLRRERLSGHLGCGCKCEWEFCSAILNIAMEEVQGLFNCKENRWQHGSGWLTGDDFVLYMEYFMIRSGVGKDQPVLILLGSG